MIITAKEAGAITRKAVVTKPKYQEVFEMIEGAAKEGLCSIEICASETSIYNYIETFGYSTEFLGNGMMKISWGSETFNA